MSADKGWSIAPAEIEAWLLEHSDIADCAMSGGPDREAGDVPRAYVILRQECRPDPRTLREAYERSEALTLAASVRREPVRARGPPEGRVAKSGRRRR
jgi:acyl-coenzyme A synthetase/AMP-(fatty) acid ligase